MKKRDLQVELRSDPQLLSCVRALVRRYVEDYGLDTDRRDKVVLAVDEACTNAIRHSYGGQHDKTLTLALRRLHDGIEIELRDDGLPAPADRVAPKPADNRTRAELKPGGLGVSFIYEAFDKVMYTTGENGGNRVTLVLKREDG